jgi:hypothetical protein
MEEQMPAEHLEEVYHFFRNQPISIDEFEALYVDADKGRGKQIHRIIKSRLLNDPQGGLTMLFAGHRGCGKSTELVRLQREIDHDFVVLNYSAKKELDIVNINYIELFIMTMERLFDFVRNEKKIRIAPKCIEDIRKWVASREIQEVNRQYMDIDIEAGMKAGTKVPFLAEFFAKFRAAAKSSTSLKETLTQKVTPKLSDLINLCNRLIDEIQGKLDKIDKKGLVLIVEDLDKVDLEKGEEIFYVHATQMTQFHCHCIFTFPIALLYNIKYNAIKNNYDEDFVLPMIKVYERNGEECVDGVFVMKKIVEQRMHLSLFEDETILTDMITYSGGLPWHLFQMIKDAADNALVLGRKAINRDDFSSAYLSLKSDFEFTIAENWEKGISVDQYYEALQECARDKTKKMISTEIMLDLRHNLSVLNYNGAQWNDVHPIVRDILKERDLL